MNLHVWSPSLREFQDFTMQNHVDSTPCREGTGWLYKTLVKIRSGNGDQSDLDLLNKVATQIEGHCICALGDAAAMPVISFLKHFWTEFEYYVDKKQSMVV